MDDLLVLGRIVLIGLAVKITGAFWNCLFKENQPSTSSAALLLGAVPTVFGLALQTAPPLGLHSRSCHGTTAEIGWFGKYLSKGSQDPRSLDFCRSPLAGASVAPGWDSKG